MRGKSLGFDQVFDLRAVRIIVEKLSDCYRCLSLVHEYFKPVDRAGATSQGFGLKIVLLQRVLPAYREPLFEALRQQVCQRVGQRLHGGAHHEGSLRW